MTETSYKPTSSIWSISDGRAGNAAQVSAIVRALQAATRWSRLTDIIGPIETPPALALNPRFPWTKLPSRFWFAPKHALSAAQRQLLSPPWPSIWIGAGRRVAPFGKAVRNWSGGHTLTVQILNPQMDAAAFDLVVVPEHDNLAGPNVLSILGSPTYFSAAQIADAKQQIIHQADSDKPTAVVILGGHSKTHQFTDEAARRLSGQLQALAAQGWKLLMTTSRRTPPSVAQHMRNVVTATGGAFWDGSEDGPNPYLSWLLQADAAIVTEDSTNMLSDVAYHGLPIHMARLSGRSPKFDRLHKSFIARGYARWFDGRLRDWSYRALSEADRTADAILDLLIARGQTPTRSEAGNN